ncbi:MAG: hypothetical protein H6537_11650 [Bacteroidales bacterium]|nr:hypothetical protein [Bacteroidales bacterium]HPD95152.1 hypothetical protein [Tenuifilaceae bacterium]HRX31821.1 hypothetical protein [Tenuifilaceae bacterium]
MKNLLVSKSRVRNYLAEKLAKNVLKADEEDLIMVLRYNALGGFEFLPDDDLFENFNISMPELDFVEMVSSDDEFLHLAVKKEHKDEEDAILVDIKRILQII